MERWIPGGSVEPCVGSCWRRVEMGKLALVVGDIWAFRLCRWLWSNQTFSTIQHIYIFLGGGLKPPNPVLYPDPRSMAFTYRGRRGEIKMAIRYPGILNTTSLAAHCAVRSQRHWWAEKVPDPPLHLPGLHTFVNYACKAPQIWDPNWNLVFSAWNVMQSIYKLVPSANYIFLNKI